MTQNLEIKMESQINSLETRIEKMQKGTFHTKMGSIKNRNGRDLTEAEDTKKRWQEYTAGKGTG